MTCPYLEYRETAGDRSFDVARAYCTAAGRFVQPMRADVCNDRYDLEHDRDCEIYLARESEGGPDRSGGGTTAPDGSDEGTAPDRSDEGGE